MKILHNILIAGMVTSVALASDTSKSKTGGALDGFFIGIEGSAMRNLAEYTQITESSNKRISILPGGTFLNKDWSGMAELKLGYYINDNNRIYAAYIYDSFTQAFKTSSSAYFNASVGNVNKTFNTGRFANHKVIIGYDYLYNIIDNNNFVVGAFLGYGLGIGNVNVSTINIKITSRFIPSEPSHFRALTHSILGGINIGYLYNMNFIKTYFGSLEFGLKVQYMKTLKSSKTIIVGRGQNGTYRDTIKGYGEVSSTGFYLGYSYKF